MPSLPHLRCLLGLCALLLLTPARASGPELLLEVRLGEHVLSDGIGAYQHGGDVLLPLGEMARILTIAIRADPAAGHASGYVLDEARGFRLDLAEGVVVRGDGRSAFDPALVQRRADDIYIASALLAQWLPVDFALDMASLSLHVKARETLPVQARLARQAAPLSGAPGGRAPAAPSERGYPRLATPYALAGIPFADQTLGIDVRRGGAQPAAATSYTAYLTGDLLGAQAALYLNTGRGMPGPAARLTLARHDPDARLLGPLKARTVQIGSVATPGVPNIALASGAGNGIHVSNRPLGQPLRSDRHSLQGDLPPGWDVELYFNGALTGIAQARADGRYSFDDQPLIYGMNEFRLVFHGPLGQLRIERHYFLVEQSMLAPGELLYTVSAQRDEAGRQRSAALFEWGLHRRLSASAGLVRMPLGDGERSYAELGAQGYFDRVIVHAALARAAEGGHLAQLGMRTRLGPLALQASRSALRSFVSDFYQPSPDPVALRDELRADAVLASMPLSLQLRRDRLASGQHNIEASARVSAYRYGTALSHSLRWQSLAGSKLAEGMLQASRRVAGVGLSGQLHYAIEPDTALSALALAADKHLDGGYLASVGVTRTFLDPHYRFHAGLNKSLGSFGFGLNVFYSSRGEYGAGLHVFLGLGRDPRRPRWISDAAPIAPAGAASLRVFLDKNRNGRMDAGEPPVAGAGFAVNGALHMARTDADGIAFLGRMAPDQHADIGLDPGTLEDPRWMASRPGVRLVPRPGKVGMVDFAVVVAGEIDGTAYIATGSGTGSGNKSAKKPAGDLEIELLGPDGAVAGRTTSTSDGYYVMAGVLPGAYRLRVSPGQLERLKLRAAQAHEVVMSEEGDVVSGKDFVVEPL